MQKKISWLEFEAVELRVGTIIDAQPFPEARKPAYKLKIDLGELGHKKSSAQITARYKPQDLIGKQVVCVTNFPEKQIGNFMSEVLVTGFPDAEGNILLAKPDGEVPNGSRLI